MGKLTYVNRKIEGSKLAQVVSRDIIKRIPPNLSHKMALRDPVVDFDISGKLMEDHDLEKISQELVKAIGHQSLGRVLILEEVSLKGNKFGAQGMAKFAPVIRVSSAEIRSLDLSDNAIEIKSLEDAIAWERFLRSFSQCTALHRLDLSGNRLGHKGFELLLKTYAFEDGLVECKATKKAQLGGLRSIPYICLTDTGLDDIGAMYLSHIIEGHGSVAHLLSALPQPKPGSQTHQLETYDQVEGCNGIIWKPNTELHNLGVKAVEAAEVKRKSRDEVQDEEAINVQLIHSVGEVTLSNPLKSPLETRSRGDSMHSLDDSNHSISTDTSCDLMRARSRIILDALKLGGLRQNDLWKCAFKILWHTRVILFGSISSATPQPSTEYTPAPARTAEDKERSLDFPPLPTKSESFKTIRHGRKLIETRTSSRTILSRSSPNIPISNRASSDSSGTKDLHRLSRPIQRPQRQRLCDIVLNLTPETAKQYAQQYRSDLPCGLPKNVWVDIISYAADGEGILSHNQKITAVTWAASKESITELRGVIGKHVSQQIYKALEGLDCLTYDV